MENILPYAIIALFYVLSDPNVLAAKILIGIAVGARFLHTIAYAIFVIPQPTRSLSWLVHFSITFYMAGKVIVHFCY